jgi:hypothetical protein
MKIIFGLPNVGSSFWIHAGGCDWGLCRTPPRRPDG